MRLSLGTVLMLVAVGSASSALAQDIWADYPDGAELGEGWDGIHAEKKNRRCIVEGAADNTDRYQTTFTTLGRLSDKEQLMHGLDITVALQARFVIGSIDAKMKYVTSADVSSESLTVAVYSTVSNGPHYLGLPRGLPRAAPADAVASATTLSPSHRSADS
jgi:hypothetical protein